MITTAFVKLWNKRIGAIAWNSETKLGSFEYDPDFLTSGLNPAPLQMPTENAAKRIFTFPELKELNTFKGLPGLLADTLPDKYGNALINAWLAKEGRNSNSLNPVEMLCFIGTRGMGALEFEPVIPKSNDSVSNLEINQLIEVAEEILSGKKNLIKNSR